MDDFILILLSKEEKSKIWDKALSANLPAYLWAYKIIKKELEEQPLRA